MIALIAQLSVGIVLDDRHAVLVGQFDQFVRRSRLRVAPVGFWKFGRT